MYIYMYTYIYIYISECVRVRIDLYACQRSSNSNSIFTLSYLIKK